MIALCCAGMVQAQEVQPAGTILSVSGTTATVRFDQLNLSVGDELRFARFNEIVDPVSGQVRGGREVDIATGIVEDVGLDRSVVSLVWIAPDAGEIGTSDRVYYTGRGKRVIRTSTVIGQVQQLISDREIEFDVGTDDEINEGDMFLVRRTEQVMNPETNEVVETRQVDVGRGTVSTAGNEMSRGEIIEFLPGMQVRETDEVIFAPEEPEPVIIMPQADPEEVVRLESEVDSLKTEIVMLRATVDSLRRGQAVNTTAIADIHAEMDRVAGGMMTDDMRGNRITLDTSGILPGPLTAELAASYRQALEVCLDRQFDRAIPAFESIISRYPDHALTENCRYWIAQSHYSDGDLPRAAQGFSDVIADARFDHKDDDAAIMLGITYYRQGQIPEALLEFETFMRRYPASEYRAIVARWLQRLS